MPKQSENIMSGRTVPSRSTVVLDTVEGDLEVGEHTVVKGKDAASRVAVSGTVYFEGDCVFECSLAAENLDGENDITVKGDLEVRNRVKIEDGRLTVLGRMTAKKVDVDRSVTVEKDFEAEEIDVGGCEAAPLMTAVSLV